MWLSGAANWMAAQFNPAFTSSPLYEQMTVEMVPLALVIALCIVLAYFLLERIFDSQVAAVAATLMALDPFHIYVSKTLHVDSMVAVFGMISALFMLAYVREEDRSRWSLVIFSGIFAGLAVLSKSPGLFLLPYVLLCLGVVQLVQFWPVRSWRDGWQMLRNVAPVFAVWLAVLVFVYFALWPAMWVQPVDALRLSFNRTVDHVSTPHQNPVLFLGQITLNDPGMLFYPVIVVISATAVTLPGFLVSIVALFQRRLNRQPRQALWLILAFFFFFLVQMSLGAKKAERYILPGFQFLIIAAGFGMVYLVRWIAGRRQRLIYMLLAGVVGIQLVTAVIHHPYYGTHYNAILGGARTILGANVVAGQEQGEGLDIAAEYLNQLPSAKLMVVGSQINESFYRYYLGKAVYMTDDNVDYLVFARNWIVRGMDAAFWGELWQRYQDRTPKFVVEFDGIPYVWIYKVGPVIDESTIEHVVNASVGNDFVLLGYDLESNQVRPGETTHLTLYWEAANKPTEDYTVFVHLLDANGQLIGQQDNQPQNGTYPTSFWEAGERVQDEYALMVDPGALAGDYTIAVGMYTLQTLQRLPVTDAAGLLLPDGLLLIKGIEILP